MKEGHHHMNRDAKDTGPASSGAGGHGSSPRPFAPAPFPRRHGPGGGGPMVRFGMPVEKAKDFKGTLKRLLKYLRPHRVQLGIVFVMAILSTLFTILSPKILGLATTALFESVKDRLGGAGSSIDFSYIGNILLALGFLYLFSSLFAYLQQYIMAGVTQRTVYDMRQQVNKKLSRLPLKYFDSQTHGETLSRVTNDIDNISSTMQQSVMQLITSIITFVGVIVMMLSISPLLTLICILTLPLSAVVTMMIAKRSQGYFKRQQQSLGELNGHVEEMYAGHQIIKVFGHERKSVEQFDSINERLYDAGWRAQFISGIIMPLMSFIGNIGYVLISVIGGILVFRDRIAIGDVQAFIQYARQFSQPITQAANIANIIQSTIASAERVFELLDEEEEPDIRPEEATDDAQTKPHKSASETASTEATVSTVVDKPSEAVIAGNQSVAASTVSGGATIDKKDIRGHVQFHHVRFGYSPNESLIEDMNIEVKPGQMVAIVGPTGAGKTTIVNLLMRFYDVNGGKITIDGRDIRDFERGSLRSIFGMVLQDTWLFNGTIRDNIAYGREGATEEEVVQAAIAAHADHFIRTLPDGYDTVLNEEASNISQGQKQLLTIARAILAEPRILILDEATSSVDTRTEIHIQRAMATLMKGRTSFVIAHRLSTIRNADMILVMNKGRIVESGTHDQLLAQKGFYAELYNSQFAHTVQRQAI